MNYSSIQLFFKKNNHFLLIPIFLYLPFIFLGYGADSDSFETLRTGVTFIKNFDYIPSRNPGYFVFEVITFFANLIGGSIATNLMAVFMSLICLQGFYQLCKNLAIPNAKLLVISVALQPYYWVASITTMDYVFALGFFFLGISLLLRKKEIYAGIAFSLAIGSRVTTVLLVFLALILLIVAKIMSLKKAAISFFLAGGLAAIFYLPPLDFVKWRWWRIFRLAMGGEEYWTLFLRTGRFLYKNIVFWSIPVILFLLVVVTYLLFKKRINIDSNLFKLILVNSLVVLSYEILFFFAPLDPSYLLVILPSFFLIIGILFQNQRKTLILLIMLIFISNFIVLDFARPDVENFATGAQYGLWVNPGYLVKATTERIKVIDCKDQACYEEKIQN